MSFERLLNPRTIAVFGGAQAQEVIRQSDRMGYKGEIWPVHPKKTEVLGRTVYRSVGMVENDPASIIELDINPLMLLAEGQGVVAADALIRLNGKPVN